MITNISSLSYGEEGYQILTITLQHLFPDQSFDLALFAPLSWGAVIHDFLIPETALLLIQDDLHISQSASIRTLRQSRVFGTIMNSSDKESSAVLDVWLRTTNESHQNEALF